MILRAFMNTFPSHQAVHRLDIFLFPFRVDIPNPHRAGFIAGSAFRTRCEKLPAKSPTARNPFNTRFVQKPPCAVANTFAGQILQKSPPVNTNPTNRMIQSHFKGCMTLFIRSVTTTGRICSIRRSLSIRSCISPIGHKKPHKIRPKRRIHNASVPKNARP